LGGAPVELTLGTDLTTGLSLLDQGKLLTIYPTSTSAVQITTGGSSISIAGDEPVVAVGLREFLRGPRGEVGPVGGTVTSRSKTLVYTDGLLTEILLYSDSGKSLLAFRKVLVRGDGSGNVTSILLYDNVGTLLQTRTLNYGLGVLIGVSDS
jgi:hypothetical protein